MATIEEVYDKMTEGEFGADDVFVFYVGAGHDHRWTRKASNGKIVWASTEWYKNADMCMKNAIRNGMKKTHTYEVEH